MWSANKLSHLSLLLITQCKFKHENVTGLLKLRFVCRGVGRFEWNSVTHLDRNNPISEKKRKGPHLVVRVKLMFHAAVHLRMNALDKNAKKRRKPSRNAKDLDLIKVKHRVNTPKQRAPACRQTG